MRQMVKLGFIVLFMVWVLPLVISAEAGGKVRLFLLKAEYLELSKKLYQEGDPVIVSSVNGLELRARAALKKGPYTITERKYPHPGGDAHDFLAFGVYYWPNEKSRDGLPWVKRDGYANPDSARDWELLKEMANSVEVLALAYYFTGNEKYAKHGALLLRTWFIDKKTRMNPNCKYSKMIPGVREGGYAVAGFSYRFCSLYDAAGILESSPAWSKEDKQALQKWTRDFMTWVETTSYGEEERRSPNNHATFYCLNMALQALYVGDKARARQEIEFYMKKKMPIQFAPDGTQPYEMVRANNYDYHRVNLATAFEIARLAEYFDDIDVWNYKTAQGGSLRQSLAYLLPYFLEQKKWEHFPGKPFLLSGHPRWRLLRRAALGFSEPGLEIAAEKVPGINYLIITDLTYPAAVLRLKEPIKENKRKPRTFLYKIEHLEYTRGLWKKGERFIGECVKGVIKRADTLLSYRPATIVKGFYKGAGVDENDFFSYGAYYWPDPKKKDGVPWILRDGFQNPDARIDWMRIEAMADAVDYLSLAYFYTGNEVYAERAVCHLRAWFIDTQTRMNPNCNYGKVIPGMRSGGYTVAGFGYIFRKVYDAAGLLEGSEAWTESDKKEFRAWTRQFIQWADTSRYGTEEKKAHNNHGTFYDMIMALQGMYVGSDDWALRAIKNYMVHRMEKQFSPEGKQPLEMLRVNNFDYCRVNLLIAFDVAQMAERFPFIDMWNHKTKSGGSLHQSVEFLLPYLIGQEKWPYYGKHQFKIHEYERWQLLHRAAVGMKEPVFKAAAEVLLSHRIPYPEHLLFPFIERTNSREKK